MYSYMSFLSILYESKSAMKITTTLLLFISCIGYIESALTPQEKAVVHSSLFDFFNQVYYQAVSNQVECRELRSEARRFSLKAKTAMPEMELDEHFVCFCSTVPYYKYLKPQAEWIFTSVFVQYSVIQTIFSLTVCRIYSLYALENPNVQQAKDCAMVASYLNVFRSMVIEDRLSEIGEIYKLAGNPSSREAKARLKGTQPDGFNMLNIKAKLLGLDDLLDRLTDVTEIEGSPRVPSVSCRGAPIEKRKLSTPFAMHLDFYTNANMNVDSAPSYALESIEDEYMQSRSNNARDENYHEYYYEKAWSDIFYNVYMDFFPMVNYFNKVLYEDEVIPIRAGSFKRFIPPIDESLTMWAIADELRNEIETEQPESMQSKVITILDKIRIAKNEAVVLPNNIRLTYQGNGNRNEPDFSVNFL